MTSGARTRRGRTAANRRRCSRVGAVRRPPHRCPARHRRAPRVRPERRPARVVHVPVPAPRRPTGPSGRSPAASRCSARRRRNGSRAYARRTSSRRASGGALAVVEGRVALGWIAPEWAGLLPECERVLGAARGRRSRPRRRAPSSRPRCGSPGPEHRWRSIRCSAGCRAPRTRRRGLAAVPAPELRADALDRRGAAPANASTRSPSAATAACSNPNLPPPSRPEDDDIEIRSDERVGIPYPEWNAWTRAVPRRPRRRARAPARRADRRNPCRSLRRCGGGSRSTPTAPCATGCDDGCRPRHRPATSTTTSTRPPATCAEPRVFRDLVPGVRDVTTALLLDGSSSLGVHHGTVFELELACADALSQAMTLARERHGIFAFTRQHPPPGRRAVPQGLRPATLRRPEPPRPRHRRLHPPRRADPPPHQPAARASRPSAGC